MTHGTTRTTTSLTGTLTACGIPRLWSRTRHDRVTAVCRGIVMRSILRRISAALAFASAVWLTATPAAADDLATCANASGDQAVLACTRAIDSGRYSGRDLIALLTNRCAEWSDEQGDKSIADCSQAIQLDPSDADAYSNRAHVYYARRQYNHAIEDLNEAIRLHPSDADLLSNRGLAYNNMGQYDHAIEDLSQAIRLNPDLADAFYNRGIAYRHTEQLDRAIADYGQAIRLNPKYAGAFNNRGLAYVLTGQFDRAIEDLDKAIQLEPNLAAAFYNRGLSWERKRDLQRALADFKKFAELAPSHPDGPKAVERVAKALNGR